VSLYEELILREEIRDTTKKTKRRVYWVPGPHHLWHIDGNHKLRRYNIVVSAAIDGFSRLCPYIRCSDNNTAITTLSHFEIGVTRYGCPSRVRTDLGGENVAIADFMIITRGSNRHSILVGKSTHNQRIERFWRDVYKEILSKYYLIFQYFEDREFDVNDECSMFVLHYLFIRLINEDLDRFRNAWNNHKLRTEHGYTPNQLIALNQDVSDSEMVDPATFGVFYGENNDAEDDDEEISRAPMDAIRCPLSEEDYEAFSNQVEPLKLSDRIFNYEEFWDRFVSAYDIFANLQFH
jgi:hypothetical protein